VTYDDFFATSFGAEILEKEARYLAGCMCGTTVISIGCGTGIIEAEIERMAPVTIIGVERDDAMIERAKERIAVVKADAENLPFRDGCAHTVMFVTSLEFMENVGKALTEAHRVLGEKGTICAVMLNTASSYFRERYDKGGYLRKHIRHINVGEIERIMAQRFSIRREDISGIAVGISGKRRG